MTLSPEETMAALKAFRTETRKGTVMTLIARGLDEADINAVAAYVATLRGR
jgi:cytochrome c553